LFARRDDVRPRVQDDHVEGRDLEPTNDVGQRVSGVDVLEDDGEVVAPVVVGDTGRDALTKVELTKRLVASSGVIGSRPRTIIFRKTSPRTCTPRSKRWARSSATVDLPAAMTPVTTKPTAGS